MATMNISLPDAMKAWVDECSRSGRYSNVSDYVRDLIRRDQERVAKIGEKPDPTPISRQVHRARRHAGPVPEATQPVLEPDSGLVDNQAH